MNRLWRAVRERFAEIAPAQWRPAPDFIAENSNFSLYGELLSTSPIIIQAFCPMFRLPLGVASVVGPILGKIPAHIIIMLSWTIEPPGHCARLARIATSYLKDHPTHKLTFLCNTVHETELMIAQRHTALTINANCLVDDTVYRPKPEIETIYDAVYNACLHAYKRHDLAVEIEKLALIYYVNRSSRLDFRTERARLGALMPKARFVNDLDSGDWRRISGLEVNDVLAQSRVGLCLSAAEGAMRASIEYLLAGLSVVSTPSLGGRNYFFDDEFCIMAEPDPRSIRDAVEALIARNIPREYVRSRTLARVQVERRRYINLVQEMIDQEGGATQFANFFWECTRGPTIMHWISAKDFSDRIARLASGS